MMKTFSLIVATGALMALGACATNTEEKAAVGAGAGAIVAGPVGAVAGAAVGTVAGKVQDSSPHD